MNLTSLRVLETKAHQMLNFQLRVFGNLALRENRACEVSIATEEEHCEILGQMVCPRMTLDAPDWIVDAPLMKIEQGC